MKLYKSWLLLATCTIILAVTTYATTEQPTKQIQAEVNAQQVAVSPSKPLKYGDKTTKKIPNKEVLFLPTSRSIDNKKDNTALQARTQLETRNRSRSRVEHKEQISRGYDRISQQQLDDQHHEIPVMHKNRELLKKQRVGIRNLSRSAYNATEAQQPQQLQFLTTQYSNLNIETAKELAQTKTIETLKTAHSRSRQLIPTTTMDSMQFTNTHQPAVSSSNSNLRTHHSTGSNSTNVRHYQNNQRNRNNNNINRNTQLLLTSSNDVTASGLQSKTKSSSNKQTGKIADNQSASSNTRSSTINMRPNTRKYSSTTRFISSTFAPTTTTIRTPFQLPNSFNIFTPEFWQFLYPTSNPIARLQVTTPSLSTATSRKPPKKYKVSTQISTKEQKLSLVKQKPPVRYRTNAKQPVYFTNYNNNNNNIINSEKNNNTLRRDEGPFRIALPTSNILSSKRETNNDDGEKGKRNVEKENINLRERFDCPRESEVRFQLFPKICKIDEDCKVWNREEICCEIFGAKSCVSGIPKPLEETSHAPILGVIPRKCPSRPLAELWWEVKECEDDMDCWPRVCCPDGRKRYCRTSQPELNTVPVPVQRSFNYLSEYLECTAPPPPIFDLHPKPCTSTFDCFPNVCCQEAGQRHCRPPKKSVLTMLANVFNVDFVKRLTQNIVIK